MKFILNFSLFNAFVFLRTFVVVTAGISSELIHSV